MKIAKFLKTFLLVFCLFSCSFGPKYQRPELSFLNEDKSNEVNNSLAWWENIEDENLKNLIHKSLQENLSIKQNKAKIEKYLARLGIAKDMLIPDIDLSASTAQKQLSLKGVQGLNPFIDRNYRQDNLTTTLNWKLDLFGSVKKQIEAAKALLEAEDQRLYDLQNSTAIAVAREYVLLASLKNQLEIADDQVKNQEHHVGLSKARFDSGIVDKIELVQNQSSLSDAQIQIPIIETQIEESYLRLDILTAQKPGSTKEFLGDKPIAIPQFKELGKKSLSSDIIKNNPNILTAEQELIAANARIGVSTAEYFPKFTFSGTYGLEAINDKNLFSSRAQTLSIGPVISWRIFDFLKINDEIKEAKAEKKEYLEAYKKAVLETIGEVEIATMKIKKSQSELKIRQNKINAQKENLELNIFQYKSGLEDFVNVINAKDNFSKAQIELIRSKEKYARSIVDFIDAVY